MLRPVQPERERLEGPRPGVCELNQVELGRCRSASETPSQKQLLVPVLQLRTSTRVSIELVEKRKPWIINRWCGFVTGKVERPVAKMRKGHQQGARFLPRVGLRGQRDKGTLGPVSAHRSSVQGFARAWNTDHIHIPGAKPWSWISSLRSPRLVSFYQHNYRNKMFRLR